MSSVLSYNQFDFGPIFKHGEKAMEKAKTEKRGEKHQPSFSKQMIYFILFTLLNLGFVGISSIYLIAMLWMQTDNIHGGDHDNYGHRGHGGHPREHPQPSQTPGQD